VKLRQSLEGKFALLACLLAAVAALCVALFTHLLGSWIGGLFSGYLMHHFGEVQGRPLLVWWCFSGFGVLISFLLWIYDRVVKPSAAANAG